MSLKGLTRNFTTHGASQNNFRRVSGNDLPSDWNISFAKDGKCRDLFDLARTAVNSGEEILVTNTVTWGRRKDDPNRVLKYGIP